MKIPFKVSARTARLIGRENIASSNGAIIELVKNGYDADSPISIIFFDNEYSKIEDVITYSYFEKLIEKGIPKEFLLRIYQKNAEGYIINRNIDNNLKQDFMTMLSKLNALYIIDFGEGMTQKVIREYWMTIGTDNKTTNYFTRSGRIKAGAKGIGRFALDKLGSNCEMITIFNPKNHDIDIDSANHITENIGYKWKVNWEDFEGVSKNIENVDAELSGIKHGSIIEQITQLISEFFLSKIDKNNEFKYGTILKITNLRDLWEESSVDEVYSDLEVLIPPKETGEFSIYVFSSLNPNKYGEVLGSVCDDYDYKLTAIADDEQNVKIKIFRKEYEVESIPKDFFIREAMKSYPYSIDVFRKGFWETQRTFSQLLNGYSDNDNIFKNIGKFKFVFYFLKKQTDSQTSKKFFYKDFMSNQRKEWLDKFAGIKLFRDNFRVRPYGEVTNIAFDWLGLGVRKAQSPAGIAKGDNGYRVEPDNISGIISISRLSNVIFEDKSSREGLQENKTFKIFQSLLIEIIKIFETDRAYIAYEMSVYDSIKYGPERNRKKAEELAKKIIEETRHKKETDVHTKNPDDSDKEILAGEIERKEEEIEKLRSEQKILRVLASNGIVLASFSHELSKLDVFLRSRVDNLKELISSKLKEIDYKNIDDIENPFYLIEQMKEQDMKIQSWFKFSLRAVRKDKRTRQSLFIKKYLYNLKSIWKNNLDELGVSLNIANVDDIHMRLFEIDLDSIFFNLLVNSMDAFNLSKSTVERNVKIIVYRAKDKQNIIVEYYDNGPGISKDIANPDDIFKPLFTTKRNPKTGKEEGTGIGMWLVKSIVEENDGKISLLYPKVGFGIRFVFPIKYEVIKNA